MKTKNILNFLNNGFAIVAKDKKAAKIHRALIASGEYLPFKKLKTFTGRMSRIMKLSANTKIVSEKRLFS